MGTEEGTRLARKGGKSCDNFLGLSFMGSAKLIQRRAHFSCFLTAETVASRNYTYKGFIEEVLFFSIQFLNPLPLSLFDLPSFSKQMFFCPPFLAFFTHQYFLRMNFQDFWKNMSCYQLDKILCGDNECHD